MKRITFDEANYSAGADVIVDAGTVVYLGNRVFLVPETTVAELKKRNVSFKEVEVDQRGPLHQVRDTASC